MHLVVFHDLFYQRLVKILSPFESLDFSFVNPLHYIFVSLFTIYYYFCFPFLFLT